MSETEYPNRPLDSEKLRARFVEWLGEQRAAYKPRNRIEQAEGGIVLITEYDAGFVDAIKNAVPRGQYKWLPERTAWFVTEANAETATALFEFFFGNRDTTTVYRELDGGE